ncbi:MAG: flavodoxin family protein [Lachnospiraceae bacterium]|nr:flavodoxin family protein [Lachnospiraceae bacterium]
MKVLGIVAGRHNGNSEILVKEALSACQEKGAECTLINLFDYNIKPCTGCESCTMMMGEMAQGKRDNYPGCVLRDKDDMQKIMDVFQQQNAIIVGVPVYDLTPSGLYTVFAQRFLAYELAFLLKIGVVKEDPHCVAGLISVGGSCHDWMGFGLESMAATMFTQSIQVVDQMRATRNGRPGNVLLKADQLARAHKMGENIIKSIQTEPEKRGWLGDEDWGLCPNCHGGLVFPGEVHWDGVQWPFECAVCGAGGDLVRDEATGKVKFVLAPDGLSRDRNKNECRDLHLDEIVETRIDFFKRQEEVQKLYPKYKEMKFKTI